MQRVALCYVRRSLHRIGIDLEGHSKERQKSVLYEWCQQHGYEPEFFEDFEGYKSGRSEVGRPGWLELKKHLPRPEVRVVVTEAVSRSHRNAKECLIFVDEAAAHEVAYVSINDGIDTRQDNPMARFQLQMLAAMAEMWSNETSSQMKASLQIARQKGQYVGTPPFGSIRNQDKKLIPDPGGVWYLPGDEEHSPEWTKDRMEAWEWRGYHDALARCYELYALDDGGYDAVAFELNAEGWRYKVRRKKGKEGNKRHFNAWKPEDVRRCICAWTLYSGHLTKGESHPFHPQIIYENAWEPILPLDLIESARKVWEARGRSHRYRDMRNENIYELTPILHCAKCGVQLGGQKHRDGYLCYRHQFIGDCFGGVGSLRASIAENLALDLILAFDVSDELKPLLVEVTDEVLGNTMTETARKRASLESLCRKRSHLVKLFIEEEIEETDYKQEKARLDSEIRQLESSLGIGEKNANNILWVAEQIRSITSSLASATREEQKELYQRLFERLDIDLDERVIVNFVPRPWARVFFEIMQKIKRP